MAAGHQRTLWLPTRYPAYSVDTCALIELCRYYPRVRFPAMWDVVAALASAGRFLLCEQVVEEYKSSELKGLMGAHPQMVVGLDRIEQHLRVLMAEGQRYDMLLVDPESTADDEADPFVVALALAVEQRDPADPGHRPSADRTCAVVTQENPRKSATARVKIPDVCAFYGLDCIKWLELLEREEYTG